MSRLRIVPIVEGHGENNAIRILLQRIWQELLGGDYVDIVKPIRGSKGRLVQRPELSRAVDLAVLKLKEGESDDRGMVLILVDADDDLPCELGPGLLEKAREQRSDMDISCVVANVEYETWFVAAASSLGEYLELPAESVPARPEDQRAGKAWIQRHFRGVKYSETVDQPAMTSRMDLALCRERSPSFDKLCRELEKRYRPEAV